MHADRQTNGNVTLLYLLGGGNSNNNNLKLPPFPIYIHPTFGREYTRSLVLASIEGYTTLLLHGKCPMWATPLVSSMVSYTYCTGFYHLYVLSLCRITSVVLEKVSVWLSTDVEEVSQHIFGIKGVRCLVSCH